MSSISVNYCPVALRDIESRLESLLTPFLEEEGTFLPSSSENVVVLVPGVPEDCPLEELLAAWTRLVPGRYFIVCPTKELTEPKTYLAAYCQKLSDDDHICSEVIRIDVPIDEFEAAASIYLHHRLGGVDSTLYLYDEAGLSPAALSTFLPFASQVVFDSETFNGSKELLRALLSSSCRLVDLNWIHSGVWRQEIRRSFDFNGATQKLHQLRSVTIQAEGDLSTGLTPQAALLGGWILEKLGLKLSCISHRGFECVGSEGRSVDLLYCSVEDNSEASGHLHGVSFQFEDEGEGGALPQIELRASTNLVLEVHLNSGYKTTSKITRKNTTSCLNRHFLVGESLSGYRSALGAYLEMRDLSNALA